MSTDTAPTAAVADDHAHDDHSHGLSDLGYVKIAGFLAVVTGAEVAWSYLHWGDGVGYTIAEVGGLLLMMAVKFFVVASFFMHLKFDSKLLTGLFYFGLGLAASVYLAVLFSMQFFS
jgi:cytochrome c oxidase subunit 4